MPTFQGRRRKLLGLSVATILVFASAIYVYWRIHAPSSSTLYVTATSPPLELRMELDKTEFQLNETVAIHLSLKNIGDKTITIIVPSLEHWVGFIVKDVNNTVVRNFPSGGAPVLDETTLGPGRQINRTYNWSQIGHYPDGSGGVLTRSVPPGTYHIIGRTGEHLACSLGAEDWIDIKTPSITITIIPPPHVTATYPPLELSMNLSKTAYQQNETIVVSLFLTNKGNEPVFLSFTHFNGHVSFIVKDENDTEVYAYPNIYLQLVDHIFLEPGEQITAPWDDPTEWNQKGNLPGKYYDKLVPQGTYKIIGRTGTVLINLEYPSESRRIETPPITLTID